MIYFIGAILALLPSYLIRIKIFGFPSTLLEILILGFLLLSVLRSQISDLSKLKILGWLNYAISLFVIAGIVSTLISPEKVKALGQLKAFIIEPILFFYACILLIKSKKDLNIIFSLLLIAASLISLAGIIQYFTFIHLPLKYWGTGDEVARIVSVFEQPNQLAMYLAPLIGFFGVLWLKKYEIGSRYLLPISLLLMSVALILTFSRAAWFALVLVGFLMILRHFGAKKALPLLIAASVVLFLIPPIQQRVRLGLSDASSLAHFDLMKIGFNKAMQDPILGNGLYGFRTTEIQSGYQEEIHNYPHNLFLALWLELGILGLISFAAIIILAWRKHEKNPNALTLAAGIFLLIVILQGFFDTPYFKNDLSVLFWFVVALAYL